MAYHPTAITSLAQGYVPFASATPTKQLWVSPTGNDSGSGAAGSPFKTISAAMSKAVPGDAVMVKAGSYTDSVRMKSGTADKPVWLISADGEGAAKITASSASWPVVYGFGNDNMVIKGFDLVGGQDGVKFTQAGTHLANFADNIVIQDTEIYGQTIDGIKLSQARNTVVVGNTVRDIKGVNEGIDLFYTRKGIVSNNEIDNIQGQGGIVVKGGSESVKVTENDVAGVQRGIVAGGYAGGNGESWPVNMGWQAKGIHIEGNLVQNTSKWAALTLGAIDSTITKNAFLPNNAYPTTVATGADDNGWHSKNIKISYNIVQKDSWLGDGSKAVTLNTGNVKTGSFDKSGVGPDDSGPAPALPPLGAPAPSPSPSIPTVTSPIWKTGGAIQATINGTAMGDTLTGTDKNEYIDGRGSHDTMTGGKGDDIYVVGSGYDKAIEKAGEGTDAVRLWIPTYTLPANIENLAISQATGASVRDNGLNNILTGGGGSDTFNFAASHGHDQIRGFKLGTDHLKIDATALSGMKAAQTSAGDLVVQHGTSSITLVGIDADTPLSALL
jgi:hypothetical protein